MDDLTNIPDVDPRNRLNDLTGREWTYALRLVISTRYPTRGPEGYAHELRRAHPSPKPPQLLAELVRFFTHRGGHVLDPTRDLQPTPEHHNMLHADIVAALREVPELEFRGYRIWHDQSLTPYPCGYPFAFVANHVHQGILIFRYLPAART